MTDPISTPAEMREAAARLVEADANEAVADVGIQLWLRGLAASIRLLPVAEPCTYKPSMDPNDVGECVNCVQAAGAHKVAEPERLADKTMTGAREALTATRVAQVICEATGDDWNAEPRYRDVYLKAASSVISYLMDQPINWLLEQAEMKQSLEALRMRSKVSLWSGDYEMTQLTLKMAEAAEARAAAIRALISGYGPE